MTSTVTNYSDNIKVLYPVPGVDNDTQGFRDNFSNIKNALTAAATEINYLQLNTAKLNTNTDYSYNGVISRAKLKSTGIAALSGSITANTDVSFLSGGYFKYEVGADLTLNFIDWPPSGNKGSIVIELVNNSTTTARSVSLDGEWTTLKKESGVSSLPLTVTASTTTTKVYELWSSDAGSTVFLRSLGTYTDV
jgi:hypothetical protein